MSYGLVITDPPADEPLTLAEAKSHLNVGHTDDDALISGLIAAAREQTETETGRRWMPQTITLSLVTFPYRGVPLGDYFSMFGDEYTAGGVLAKFTIPLPYEPVSAVNAIRYYDATGVLQTLAAGTDYLPWLSHSPPVVYPAPGRYWPFTQIGRLGAVEVEFVCGYANADAVPASAKAAMKLALGLWYENRGDAEDPTGFGLPPAALRLVRSLHTGYYS